MEQHPASPPDDADATRAGPTSDPAIPAPRPKVVLPPSSAVSPAELAADQWVLLAAPTRRFVIVIRAIALLFATITLAGLTLGGTLVGLDRSWWQWTVLALGILLATVGLTWTWQVAALPRPIDAELYRLAPNTGAQRRHIARLLRQQATLTGPDRPAAAAHTAGMQPYRLLAATWLAMTGLQLTLNADTITTANTLTWLSLALFVLGTVGWLAAAGAARTTMAAAHRAGVAPLESNTTRR